MAIKAKITTREITANTTTNQIEAKIVTNKIEVATLGRQGVTGLTGPQGDQGDTGPVGPGSTWGGIIGTLSDQVDLKAQQDTQDTAISLNTSKISYTDSAAVALNTAKISYTDAAAVALNTAKVSYDDQAAVALNTAKNTYPSADSTKLAGIEALAEVNTIDSGDNVSLLTNDAAYLATVSTDATLTGDGTVGDPLVVVGAGGSGDMTKVVYDPQTIEADAFARANHTGTITASVVSDFDVEVANNSVVVANGVAATDNKEHIDQFSSTGLTDGCDISINVGGTTVDISVGEGEVFDNYTDPTNPVHTHHTFAGVTGLTLTNIGTTIVTFLGLRDSTGVVSQQSTQFTAAQRREYWWTGFATHLDLATVGSTGLGINSVTDQNNSLRDLWASLGIVTTDCSFSANGANLNLDRSAGLKSFTDINYETDRQDPNNKTMASGTALSFSTMYQNGSGGFTTITDMTAVDVGNIDDGTGTLDSMSPNRYQIKRIYFFSNGFTTLTYGQVEYNSFDAAVAGIQTELPVINPLLLDQDLRCFLVCKSNGSDLSDTTQALFSNTPKFGNVGSGGAGSSGSSQDLQATYNLSVNPEILTDSTRGAFTMQRGSAADTDNVYEGQNGAGSVTFSVDGNGDVLANNISSWDFYTLNARYTGIETIIASGSVREYTINAVTIYRFVDSTTTGGLVPYPIEDSFYADFSDPTLSNLIVTRG